jgi:hypothetical protein
MTNIEPKEEPICYVSKKSCGCVTFAAVNEPRIAKDIAKEISACIRNGETISTATCEEVRQMEWKCPTHRKQGKQLEQAALS